MIVSIQILYDVQLNRMRNLKRKLLFLSTILALVTIEARICAEEGFCGYQSARACCDRLGIAWTLGPKAKCLAEKPVATMSDIVFALEEHQLNVLPIWADEKSIRTIRRWFRENNGSLIGIACLQSSGTVASGSSPGHFFVVTEAHNDSSSALSVVAAAYFTQCDQWIRC